MKKCPVCKMTVDSHNTCPVCNTDITNQPYENTNSERYVLNKYFFLHLLKKHKFPIFCALFVLVKTAIDFSNLNWWCIVALLFAGLSVFCSLFPNLAISLDTWKYSEDYAESRSKIGKYTAGIIGVLISLLFW